MMSGMLAKAIRQEKSIWNGKEVMFNVEYKTPKESIKNLLEILSISLQDSRSIYQISNHISIEWKAKIRENYPIYKKSKECLWTKYTCTVPFHYCMLRQEDHKLKPVWAIRETISNTNTKQESI